jgi:hypothetical protein
LKEEKMKIVQSLLFVFAILFFVITSDANAWDGYDYEKGAYIEIEKGNLVREGETIEIYDYNDGEYKDVDVESIENYGSTVEVEVYDPETGETRILEMED